MFLNISTTHGSPRCISLLEEVLSVTTVCGRTGRLTHFLVAAMRFDENCLETTLYRVWFLSAFTFDLMFAEAWSWWSCDQREGS